MSDTSRDWLHALIDAEVVVEMGESFTAFGTLTAVGPGHIEMAQVDLHDQREANSSRDVYAMETKQLGVRPNRKRLFIPWHRVVAISTLQDIEP